jgi:ferredoxin
MKRQIVQIDEERCTGCGLCVDACHEGALRLVNGKARLVSESYCDGLGNCLPECPAGAITIEERDAANFDEEAVKKHMDVVAANSQDKPDPETTAGGGTASAAVPEGIPEQLACGCPGTSARLIRNGGTPLRGTFPAQDECPHHAAGPKPAAALQSQLRQWPCQIRLVPVGASYLNNAHLLVAADCTAYAYAGIHSDFMQGRITLIGCPKLDPGDYAEKLTEILKAHQIKSIKVLRMEVPCCGGIVAAVQQAMESSGRMIPWSVVTIGTDGRIVEEV